MGVNDQAGTLRELMRNRKQTEIESSNDAPANVITISSGKGGVGKSCLAANLASLLARSGVRTMLVDGDCGVANLEIILGVQSHGTLEQVMLGEATLQKTIVGVEPNLWLLPSSSGFHEAMSWNKSDRTRLLELFEGFPWEMDLIIMDAGSGLQENVLDLHSPKFHNLVVLTPEPTSLADAYALIKTLRRKRGIRQFQVIVNQVTDGKDGLLSFQRLREVTCKFTDVELSYLGHCARDEKMGQAVMKRKILLDWNEGTESVRCLGLISKRIRSEVLGFGFESFERKQSRRTAFGRFQEEPAQRAPRNAAGFWQTLLLG